MEIPFTKAHGAGNDFLLSNAVQATAAELRRMTRAICERHTGVGADGWILMGPGNPPDYDASIRLFNSDGSEAEISGNGTRCTAALLVAENRANGDVRISTDAGVKHLRLTERRGRLFSFEMNMGLPQVQPDHVRFSLPLSQGTLEATILHVGNPQCAIQVQRFPENWKQLGAEIESHALFPKHTNVSFYRVLNEHAIEVLFYERGAGETLSSGTGSTAAAAAAILRNVVSSPVRVITAVEDLHFRWDDSVYLTGPAEIVGAGKFYFD
jgi:diaminopimelate epimerase